MDKKQLIEALHHPETVASAIETLKAEGWLEDGSLHHAMLAEVDFSHQYLMQADLQSADLSGANLQHCDLFGAKLAEATLRSADLTGAYLDAANLAGADLSNANLKDADIGSAFFDRSTTLPDSKRWSPELDLSCYTNPQHPDYFSYADNRRWYSILKKRLANATGRIQPDAEHSLTLEELDAVYQASNGFCHYCDAKLDQYGENGWTVDHKTPLVLGGDHAKPNIVIACQKCNSQKGDMPYQQFIQRIKQGKYYQQLSLWDETAE